MGKGCSRILVAEPRRGLSSVMGCRSQLAALTMVSRLAESAECHWHRPDGCQRSDQLIEDARFRNREPLQAAEEDAAYGRAPI
jgi:hypothetical protein